MQDVAFAMPASPAGAEFDKAWTDAVNRVLSGQAQPAEALARREARWAYLFLAPWIVGFLVFNAGPMIASAWLSLTEYDAINAPRYTGLDNYRELMADPMVERSLGNTVYYTLLHVPLVMAISLGLALLLKRVGRL
ncbi:hypothetical protein M8I35_06695 [Micromonospora sp. MSM11]|nr:hypothetical protein [Micromonospora sp. MSM11]MCL7456866.1 hypothetical protein [Micromonospora sp. MSM11]